jgi:PAS domain S-box-containing protein
MKKKILIIEDDPLILETTVDFLKEEGFEVYIATNGVEGIQKAIEIIPDLIISDITMPNKNGYEVCKTLQSIPGTSTIPFIFLTARIQKDDVRHGMQLGADDYLTKPFDYSELLKSITIRLEKQERIQKAYEEKFYKLIDNPLMGVFIYSGKKFEYVNSTFSKMFGLNVSDFENMNFDDIIVTEPSEQIIEKIKRTLEGIQDYVQLEFEAFYKEKQKKLFVGIYANLITFKGVPALVGNAIDISEKESKKDFFKEADNTDSLSKREIDILKQLCQGHTTAEIAKVSCISIRTVDTHRSHLLSKTESKNTSELILYALRKRIFVVE